MPRTAGGEGFLTELLPGLLTRANTTDLTGTRHLRASDGPLEWFIDLDNCGLATPEQRKSDTSHPRDPIRPTALNHQPLSLESGRDRLPGPSVAMARAQAIGNAHGNDDAETSGP
jgi:hypothetical protein